MTDPGWDIPGVPREPSPGADMPDSAAATVTASPADASQPRRGKSGRKARTGSVSANSGLSPGAFAPLPDASKPKAECPASPPGSAGDSSSCAALPAVAPNAAARNGSASVSGTASGSTCPPSRGRDRTASVSTASNGTASNGTASDNAGRRDARAGSDGSVPAGTGASNGPDEVLVTDPVQAMKLLSATLVFLAHASPAEWAEGIQADCLRALAVAESQQTVAHATILQAFSVPGGGLAGDGHRSPRVWLTWQCAATRRAASSKVSWMHRLNAHPVISRALAGGSVSVSWAAQIMDWTRTLPGDVTDAADAELLAAAAA
ncbi:MAG TPA: hypothetical protein VMA72_18230, partial [Streptosporangiaceae bacterium]|nr:hypothetical protein [Streptosporangiaceae bacterium]